MWSYGWLCASEEFVTICIALWNLLLYGICLQEGSVTILRDWNLGTYVVNVELLGTTLEP